MIPRITRFVGVCVVGTAITLTHAQDKPAESKPGDAKKPEAKQAAAKQDEAKPAGAGDAKKADAPPAAGTESHGTGGPLAFSMKTLDGKDVDLAQYKGKVVMMVNVASQCGLTPQYEQLEAVNKKYAEKGLVVLGFPANNFGGQEPGTSDEIREFCTSKYGVTFPMFAKVSVKGEDCCPLYKFLTGKSSNGKFAGDIKWNFTKFLIGRDGNVAARFEPKTKPDADEVVKAIEAALAAKP